MELFLRSLSITPCRVFVQFPPSPPGGIPPLSVFRSPRISPLYQLECWSGVEILLGRHWKLVKAGVSRWYWYFIWYQVF